MTLNQDAIRKHLARLAGVVCSDGVSIITDLMKELGYVEPPMPKPEVGQVWKSGDGHFIIVSVPKEPGERVRWRWTGSGGSGALDDATFEARTRSNQYSLAYANATEYGASLMKV